MKVRDLMSYPIATVRPEDTVLTAVKRMAGEKKGSVLVARDCLLKECLGIVTTSQIFLRVFAEGRDPAAVFVQDIMTAGPLVSIDLDASTAEAARLMMQAGRNVNPRAREMAQARWRVPGSCERCGLLLAGSTNLNADAVCDVCDAELRAGRLYGANELSAERRRELGYGGG